MPLVQTLGAQPARSPFQVRDVASSGVTTPVSGYVPIGSQIVSGVKDVVGMFGNLGQAGVRNAQAGYYRSEAERAAAEGYKATTEGEKAAAAVARQQKKDADALEGQRQYDAVLAQTGDPVRAERARQDIIAPYYLDEHGAAGITAMGANSAVLSGVDPTGGAGPPTPIQRAARNIAAGFDATAGHALQGPYGSTDLTYDENRGDITAERQRQIDQAALNARTELGKAGIMAGAEVQGAKIHAAADERIGAARDRAQVYSDVFKPVFEESFRYRTGQPPSGGQGQPAHEVKTIAGPSGKVMQTQTVDRSGSTRVPNLPPGRYPVGPAGPSLQGNAGAPAAPAKPSLDQFMAAARKANPGVSDQELTDYYNKTYR